MRAVVGVTDNSWASFLRDRPQLTEANFWIPSGLRSFKMISAGEPFLFKTKKGENKLVGGGFLSGWAELRVSEAWENFGEANGVAGQGALLDAINGYRRKNHKTAEPDPTIGCVLLRDTFFVPADLAWDAPPDFPGPIVRWKGYDLAAPNGSHLEQALQALITTHHHVTRIDGPMFGDPRLVAPRLGQGAFKSLVGVAYHRRCAITGNKVTPTLQAAHIRPVADHGEHRLDNGLLLRSDVHTLFDRGYLGVDARHHLHVSPRLCSDFGNGDEFYALAGSAIGVPERDIDRPNQEFVTWHMDTVFKAS